jgi:integrase
VLSDPTLRPRTAEDYRRTARHLEGLRPVRLDRITPYALAAVLHPLRARPRLALKVYQLLSRVLRQAVRLGLVGSNPLEGLERPRYRPERARPWAPEQVAAFLQAARGHPMEGLFWVLSTGGLRVSEATALRWCDFDFQRAPSGWSGRCTGWVERGSSARRRPGQATGWSTCHTRPWRS